MTSDAGGEHGYVRCGKCGSRVGIRAATEDAFIKARVALARSCRRRGHQTLLVVRRPDADSE